MLTSQEFLDYLIANDGFYGPPNVILLKKRNVSNAYFNQRFFNDKVEGWEDIEVTCLDDLARVYVHHDILVRIGEHIGAEAKRLGTEVLIGIITTGETFAKYAHFISGIPCEVINPHDEVATPSGDISGKRVFPIDDTVTTGGSIKDAIEVCENNGAIVVGAYATLRRDAEIDAITVKLTSSEQEFVILTDIDFTPVVEKPDGNSTLLKLCATGESVIRLDIGYAAEDDWPVLHPEYTYVGISKKKTGL